MPVGRAGILSCCRLPLLAAAVAACALALPGVARAELLTVDTNADAPDAALGAGGCATAAGKCSLRAAIEESNASVGESDEIFFGEEPFDGSSANAIVLAAPLPPIDDPARVNGRECETEIGIRGPCVEIVGVAGATGLAIEGAPETEVEGVSIVAAEVGIAASGSSGVRIRGSWLGIGLDGAAAGNGTGIRLASGSDRSRVGGEGADAGNLIGNSDGAGLAILGASEVRVLGNRFGVAPAGATAAPNGTDLQVASTASSDAAENVVGTRVGSDAAASAICDGGCNVISGSQSSGIDLGGDGGELQPAIATTVTGNQIGLDSSGLGAVPNGGAGILVGSAPQTVIGGGKAGSANTFAGGAAAVEAGGAPDLVVRGNLIGESAAAAALPPPADGIVVSSEGLTTSAVEALITDNRIALSGGTGIAQQGFGAWLAGNAISGATNGIVLSGLDEGQGNLVEGNSVEGTEAAAILIENDANEVNGNHIVGAGAAGVEIRGPLPFGATDNLIGGDTAAEENTVDGSSGAAIAIVDLEGTQNEVARNRGAGNLGAFIDLAAASPGTEPTGPNGGVAPPAFATTESAAAGTAEPGAAVRVYRKGSPLPGELNSFLGLAIADEDGNWSLAYAAALPPGTSVAASQTNPLGGSSELAFATVASAGAAAGAGSAPSAAERDTRAPQTRITAHPRPRSKRLSARFRFAADEAGSSFVCSLDGRRYRPCRSPKAYTGLRPGAHVFRVRAVDPTGNVDPQPARWRFKVVG